MQPAGECDLAGGGDDLGVPLDRTDARVRGSGHHRERSAPCRRAVGRPLNKPLNQRSAANNSWCTWATPFSCSVDNTPFAESPAS